jgi:ribosome-associated protein
MLTQPSDTVDRADASAEAAERPSKTQRKRSMHELQQLGEALAALPAAKLAQLEMPDALREAIAQWQHTRSHEGRRRQMQYVGKLMRATDPQPLREALAREQLGSAREKLALHRAEHWRDELIADDAAFDRFVAERPEVDQPALRRLIRAARAPTVGAGRRHDRSYRELFRFLTKELDPT